MESQGLCKQQVLGLDIATMCGYYSTHESGAWNFYESKARNDNKQHKAFRATLIDFITQHDIRQVVAEDVNVNNHFIDMRKLSEFRGILLEVCDELNLPEPVFLNVSSIKKFATGSGRATKLDMIRACVEKYNYRPRTDDEADAFWVYRYYCHKYHIF
jgi:Holliday junction resolvasome RuvABC endonuclease subunit